MILTAILIVAFASAILCLCVPRARDVALGASIVLLGIGAYSIVLFDRAAKSYQLTEQFSWVRFLDVNYHVGIDGISYPMVLLTLLLCVVAVLVSRREIMSREREYYALLL
jgi:NADH:ubiquinone oxidoreductase subunit 4 (subunit M)